MKATGGGEAEAGFELVPLAGGINSLRSRANGQTFHPVVGPQKEAETVHVGGTRLVERANALEDAQEFVVWDVGLGAAANALAAIRALAAGYRRTATISLCSFDRDLGALEFALEQVEKLGYPLGYESILRRLRDESDVHLPIGESEIVWEVALGDFPTLLGSEHRLLAVAPNAIFYDPYSPSVNPEMWTLETFAGLRACTQPQTPCLLTTYTRSTAVRVTLLLAGWFVGIGGATGEKDETTVAANVPGLVERPLPHAWLEGKVHASTNAAPLRVGGGATRGPISEEDFARLREHPQFAHV